MEVHGRPVLLQRHPRTRWEGNLSVVIRAGLGVVAVPSEISAVPCLHAAHTIVVQALCTRRTPQPWAGTCPTQTRRRPQTCPSQTPRTWKPTAPCVESPFIFAYCSRAVACSLGCGCFVCVCVCTAGRQRPPPRRADEAEDLVHRRSCRCRAERNRACEVGGDHSAAAGV